MLFDDKTEAMILAALEDDKLTSRESAQEPLDLALAYANGEMLIDVQGQLAQQYMMRQQTEQPIVPHVLPLVQFFTDESAIAYQSGAARTLVHRETKETNVELTKRYIDFWDASDGSAVMQEVDRRLVLYKSTGLFTSHAHGKMDLRIVKSHDIFPLRDPLSTMNPAHQESYEGFVIDHRINFGETATSKRLYTLIKPEGSVQYKGTPNRITDIVGSPINNPLMWPEIVLDSMGRPTGAVQDQPLQMLMIANARQPTERLFDLTQPAIFVANQAINVQWSVLHDVVRWQAGALPVINAMDKNAMSSVVPVGVNNPLVLDTLAEKAEFITSGNDYEGLIDFLTTYTKVMGLLERLAPDDLAVNDTKAPESGFAKYMANLPKIRAVGSRRASLVRTEKELFKRVASLGVWLGVLPSEITNYELKIEFEPVEIPMSITERVQEETYELEQGFTTRAKILASRTGVSEEEALEQIALNLEANALDAKGASGASVEGENANGLNRFSALINSGASDSASAASASADVDSKNADSKGEQDG